MGITADELLISGKLHRQTHNSWDNVYRLIYASIAEKLKDNEEVLYAISTGAIARTNLSSLFVGALAVTKTRLIYGGQNIGLFKNTYVSYAIDIKNIASLSVSYGARGAGRIVIKSVDCDDIALNFESKEKALIYQQEIMQIIDKIKDEKYYLRD